jgi:hypothetical protein
MARPSPTVVTRGPPDARAGARLSQPAFSDFGAESGCRSAAGRQVRTGRIFHGGLTAGGGRTHHLRAFTQIISNR